jgi:polyphosphate kinase
VDEGHAADAPLAVPEELERRRIGDLARLQVQEARYNLQVVLNAMMDLAKKRLLLAERGLQCSSPSFFP